MPRALIVDADAAAMRILRITLANIADCFFAESGDEAFELAHRILPDVILLDADMPNVDAFAACESLRTDPSLTDVPIVFVSRACDQLNRIRALDRGATDVISKPYLRAVLRAHVSKLVQSKRCGDAIREDRRKAIASMSSD
jgi:PleD family two-component response regulator